MIQKYRIYFWITHTDMRSILIASEKEPVIVDKYRVYINDTEFVDFEPYPINILEGEVKNICEDCEFDAPACGKCIGA